MTSSVQLEPNVAVLAMRARLTPEPLPEADAVGLKNVMLRLLAVSGQQEPLNAERVVSQELETLIAQHKNALSIYDELRAAGYDVQRPPFPPRLAGAFLQLAQLMSTRPNFRSYSFLEDMIQDAVLLCLLKWDRAAQPGKVASYFGRVIYNAFVKRINAETKHNRTIPEKLDEAWRQYDTRPRRTARAATS